MNRKSEVLLYVIGELADLQEKGLIVGGQQMTKDGFRYYQRLKETGFKPTEEELKNAAMFLYYRRTEDELAGLSSN